MKKIITIIILALLTLTGCAQVVGDSLIIYGGGSFEHNVSTTDTATYDIHYVPMWQIMDSIDYGTSAATYWTRLGNYLYPKTITDSIGIGTNSPDAILDVAGRIEISNTGGSVFIGEGAGLNDDLTSNSNVFIGNNAGMSNTVGNNNVGIGINAMKNSVGMMPVLGNNNTIIGADALFTGVSTVDNTAIGRLSLYYSTGDNNTAIGAGSLENNTAGFKNTAIGQNAGKYYGSGLDANETSSTNTYIGYDTRANVNNTYNEIVIGHEAIGNGSNTATILDDNGTDVWMGEDGQADIHGNNMFINDFIIFDDTSAIFSSGYAGTNKRLIIIDPAGLDKNSFIEIISEKNSAIVGNITIASPEYVEIDTDSTIVTGDISVNGGYIDSGGDIGTSGQVLSSTSTGTNWIESGLDSYWSKTGAYVYPKTLTDRIGIGTNTPSALLDVAGHIAITSTGESVFIGKDAGLNDDLSDNRNVFIGFESGKTNTSGYYNTAIGHSTLNENTSSFSNTAIGFYALKKSTSGYCTAIGNHALSSNTTGYSNTAIGSGAGKYITNGTTGNETGTYNTFIGYNTKASTDGTTNETAIGYDAIGNGSNTTTIGNDDLTDIWMGEDGQADIHAGDGLFSGNVGIGTSTPLNPLHLFIDNTTLASTPILKLEQDGTGDCNLQFLLSGSAAWNVGVDNSDGNKFKISGDGTGTWTKARLTIDAAGNVGIGTSSPITGLDVISGNTIDGLGNIAGVFSVSNGATVDTKLALGSTAGSRPFIAAIDGTSVNAASLDFYISSNLRMRLIRTVGALQVFNGSTPSTAANSAQFYVLSGEMWVKDGGGTATQLSSHTSDAPDWMYDSNDAMPPQIDKEMNDFDGIVRYTNNTRKNKLLQMQFDGEQLPTGNARKFIFTETYAEHNTRTGNDLQIDSWNDYQDREVVRADEEISKWEAKKKEWKLENDTPFKEDKPKKHIKQNRKK